MLILMRGVVVDWVRAASAAAGIALACAVSVPPRLVAIPPAFAQAAAPALAADAGGEVQVVQEPVMEWALRQGGALAILVIVLFFYRRDYRYLTEFWKEQHQITTQLVADNTKAVTEIANALRENNVVVHATKNVLIEVMRNGGPSAAGGVALQTRAGDRP